MKTRDSISASLVSSALLDSDFRTRLYSLKKLFPVGQWQDAIEALHTGKPHWLFDTSMNAPVCYRSEMLSGLLYHWRMEQEELTHVKIACTEGDDLRNHILDERDAKYCNAHLAVKALLVQGAL